MKDKWTNVGISDTTYLKYKDILWSKTIYNTKSEYKNSYISYLINKQSIKKEPVLKIIKASDNYQIGYNTSTSLIFILY